MNGTGRGRDLRGCFAATVLAVGTSVKHWAEEARSGRPESSGVERSEAPMTNGDRREP